MGRDLERNRRPFVMVFVFATVALKKFDLTVTIERMLALGDVGMLVRNVHLDVSQIEPLIYVLSGFDNVLALFRRQMGICSELNWPTAII